MTASGDTNEPTIVPFASTTRSAEPAGPAGPRSPSLPAGPRGPISPCGPASPRAPCSPRRPCGPIAPTAMTKELEPLAPWLVVTVSRYVPGCAATLAGNSTTIVCGDHETTFAWMPLMVTNGQFEYCPVTSTKPLA